MNQTKQRMEKQRIEEYILAYTLFAKYKYPGKQNDIDQFISTTFRPKITRCITQVIEEENKWAEEDPSNLCDIFICNQCVAFALDYKSIWSKENICTLKRFIKKIPQAKAYTKKRNCDLCTGKPHLIHYFYVIRNLLPTKAYTQYGIHVPYSW